MKPTVKLLLFVPVLLALLGMDFSCFPEPVLFIEEPADGAVIGTHEVHILLSYENANSDSLSVTLNGDDITGAFARGDSSAEATLTLADGDYDLLASIDGRFRGTATAESSFTVQVAVVPEPTSIEIVSGDGQSGTVGETLAQPLVVRILDQFGDPFGGALVSFSANTGSVFPANDLSAPDGTASTSLTLPTAPGDVTVTAELDANGQTVQFAAEALAGPAAHLSIYSGDNQDGLVFEPLAEPLVVLLTDAYGNPVEGDPVTFSSGDGTVDPALANTDADGLAGTEYTLGGNPGIQHVDASATTTAATVTFTINASYTPVIDELTLVVPSPVSADVGETTATATALDQYGAPLPGLAVTITSTIGVAGPVTDNGDGTYSSLISGLVLVGTGEVTASAGGLSDVQPLEVTAGAPAILDLVVPPTVDASIGEVTALVTLTDANGNGLAGVAGTITSTIGSVGPIADLGNGSYTAQITGLTLVGATATVEASFAGLTDSGTIQILGAGVPTSIEVDCPSIVNADAGTMSCSIRVRDQFGQGVPDLTLAAETTCGAVSDGPYHIEDGLYGVVLDPGTIARTCTLTVSYDLLEGSDDFTVVPGQTRHAYLAVDSPVSADVGETTATVAFTDAWGNAKPGLTVLIVSTGGTVGAVTEGPAGTYSAPITDLTTAGDYTVTASADGVSDDAPLAVVAGDPAAVSLVCQSPVSADSGASACEVSVEDAFGNGNAGETLILSSTCGATFSSVSDNGGGAYSFTASNLRTAGTCTITAGVDTEAKAASAIISDSFGVTVTPGATAHASLTVPSPISADVGQTTATAAFTDNWGNAKPGLTVSITSTGGSVGSVSEGPAGTYQATIIGLTTAGSYTVTASADGVSDDAPLVVTAGAPAVLTMTCQTPVSADVGSSECPLSVVDQYGNPNTGQTIARSNTCGGIESAVTELGGGNYVFQVADLRIAGPCSITASAGAASDTDPITVTPGATRFVTYSVGSPVSADVGQTTAQASFTDNWGNAKPGLAVSITSEFGTVGPITEGPAGTYTATITDLRVVGTYGSTASADGISDTKFFAVNHGAPAVMNVTATSPVPADGITPSNVTAALQDAWGNWILDGVVTITSTLGTVGPVTNNFDGTYSAQVTSATPGEATITAQSGAASDTTTVTFYAVCNTAPDPNGGTNGCEINGTLEVTVIDDATKDPVSGAFVQAGPAPDDPFPANWGYTDANGRIAFSHADLVGPLTVTAGKPGSAYAFASLADVDSNRIVLPLKYKARTAPLSRARGDVGGFSVPEDNNFDLSLVIPTLNIDQLLTFNLDSLLAPEVTRQIVGPLGITIEEQIPGNVYAPSQSERINYVLPNIRVTLNFTPYEQLGVETNTFQRFFCLAGRVPDQQAVDLLTSGAELTEILAIVSFRQAGISPSYYITGDLTVPTFNLTRDVTATLLANVYNTPAATDVYVAPIADLNSLGGTGALVPMGLKVLAGGTNHSGVSLTRIVKGGDIPSYTTIAGAAALAQTGAGLTTQVQRSGLDGGGTPTAELTSFFDIIAAMNQAGTTFSFANPQNAVSPDLDMQVTTIYLGLSGSDTKTYLWDILAPTEAFELPTLPAGVAPLVDPLGTPDADFLVWEAAGYGLTINGAFDFDEFAFEDTDLWITHFTYNNRVINYPY